MGYVSSFVAML